jgi:hypothetical protein
MDSYLGFIVMLELKLAKADLAAMDFKKLMH